MRMAVMNKRKIDLIIMYATIVAKQLKYNKFCSFFFSSAISTIAPALTEPLRSYEKFWKTLNLLETSKHFQYFWKFSIILVNSKHS